MKQRARLFIFGAAPLAAAVTVFACGDDAKPPVMAPDAESDAPVSSPEAGAEPEGGGLDARVPFDPSDEPVTCTVEPCVVELVAGTQHFCALLEDETIRCWGNPLALGVRDAGSSPPRPISMGLSGVEQISAAGFTTCARLIDGTTKCWGTNGGNELGLEPPGPDYASHDPTTVMHDGGALDGIVRIDVGASVTFAVRAGELWSWGNNGEHVLGRPRERGNFGDSWLGPGPLTYLDGVSVTRAEGRSYDSSRGSVAFAITSDHRLLTWGTAYKMIAHPGPVPVAVSGLENVGSAGVTAVNICAVADGQLYCWGENGLLACTGSTQPATSPVAIETHGYAAAQQVSLGDRNTCVREADGAIECCGDDERGQLGRAAADGGSPPAGSARILVQATGFHGRAVKVAVGSSTICALVQGGTVQCWGGNDYGQLGQGTVDNERHSTPVTVQFD